MRTKTTMRFPLTSRPQHGTDVIYILLRILPCMYICTFYVYVCMYMTRHIYVCMYIYMTSLPCMYMYVLCICMYVYDTSDICIYDITSDDITSYDITSDDITSYDITSRRRRHCRPRRTRKSERTAMSSQVSCPPCPIGKQEPLALNP